MSEKTKTDYSDMYFEFMIKNFSKSVQDLVTYNHKNNDVWYMCEQNKKGKFVDGTSKFMKLVKERMKALNFDKRVNDICRLLDSGVTA